MGESEGEELVLEKKVGNHVFTQGLEKKNAKAGEAKNSAISFGSYDFLGMSAREELREVTKMTLDKYGCGSCGPRGFYGSIDSHVLCEQQYAKFMEVDEGIAYSDSASSVSSTLPAFAKRGDLVIADAGCHEPITTAINLSRAICKTFSHNDMDHLERILEDIKKTDIEWGRNTKEQKRFIVVEGLYKNYGDIAPLDKLIELKKKYCFRLVVDESYSFGCFGKGKGITELRMSLYMILTYITFQLPIPWALLVDSVLEERKLLTIKDYLAQVIAFLLLHRLSQLMQLSHP